MRTQGGLPPGFLEQSQRTHLPEEDGSCDIRMEPIRYLPSAEYLRASHFTSQTQISHLKTGSYNTHFISYGDTWCVGTW